MKFITNRASLLLLTLPSTMALRGAHHRSLGVLNDEEGNKWTYRSFNGGCTLNKDGSGSGSEGEEFHRFNYADYVDILSADWCEDRCNDEGSECTGFAYLDSGDDSYCDVWVYPIGGISAEEANLRCFMRVYEHDGGGGDDDEEPRYNHLEGACRKDLHGTLPGEKYIDFERISGTTEEWCRETCHDQASCTAYEYYSSHQQGDSHCELWRTAVLGYEPLPDYDCYVKY